MANDAREAVETIKTAGFLRILKDTVSEWTEDNALRLSAAVAYYTIFSLAPLLMIALAIAGAVFGKEAAQGQLGHQLQTMLGDTGAKAVQEMIANAGAKKGAGLFAGVVGLITLIFGATGAFAELKESLNTIWGVEEKPGRGIMNFIKERFLSFGMVLVIGFLLLVSLVASALLSAVATFLGGLLPVPAGTMHILDFVISFAAITLLLALMFKYLPDVHIAWSNVWIGSAATALLFTIGKIAIGLYLGKSSVSSSYGSAGSLVVVLLWIYYSSIIVFFGAEFTQVYAKLRGVPVTPSANAIPLQSAICDLQGRPIKRQKAVGFDRDKQGVSAKNSSADQPQAEKNETEVVRPPYRPIPNFRKGEPIQRLVPKFLAASLGNRILNKINNRQGQA